MKKYSDWQKYVKEQIDRMGDGAPGESRPPQPQTREKQSDGFIIRRKDQPAPAPPRDQKPAASAFPPHPAAKSAAAAQAPHTPKPQQPAAQPSDEIRKQQELFKQEQEKLAQHEPAQPIASPFVSVGEIWKAAEKSSRTPQHAKPAAAHTDTAPRQQPAAAPAPPREPAPAKQQTKQQTPAPRQHAAPAAPPQAETQTELQRAQRGQSREEILERLVNPTISLEEAAKIMGVCKATVRRYTAMGILPHYRTPGNQRRFKLNDIITFLESQKK